MQDICNVPGGLVHHVIGDVLRTPEARFQRSRPKDAALLVFKSHRHLCIINPDACTVSIPNAGIGVVVANERHRSGALKKHVGGVGVLNDEYRVRSSEPQEQLASQVSRIGIRSKRTDEYSVNISLAMRLLPEGGSPKCQSRQEKPKNSEQSLDHVRTGKVRLLQYAAPN